MAEISIEKLIKDLNSTNPATLERAITYATGNPDERLIPHLVKLTHHEDIVISNGAIGALGEIGDKGLIALDIDELKDPSFRQSALNELYVLRHNLGIYANDKDPEKRKYATEALVMLREAVPSLITLLGDNDAYVSNSAATALNEYDSPEISRLLINALGDKNRHIRKSVADYFGPHGSEGAVEPLSKVLLTDPDPEVRTAVAEALGVMGYPAALGALTEAALKDKNSDVCMAGVEAVVKIDAKGAVESLSKVLVENKDHPEVRMAAANALGDFKDRRALESLKGALGDEDSGVRNAAALATTKIMKEKYDEETAKRLLLGAVTSKDSTLMKTVVDYQRTRPEIKKTMEDATKRLISTLPPIQQKTAAALSFTIGIGGVAKKPGEERKKVSL